MEYVSNVVPLFFYNFICDVSFQHWECKLLFTLFVYTISACAMWIFMEALYLYMMVYKTMFTEKHGVQLYVIFGWCKFLLSMNCTVSKHLIMILKLFLKRHVSWYLAHLSQNAGVSFLIKKNNRLSSVVVGVKSLHA